MEIESKDVTPEQRKAISSALNWGRLFIVFAVLKSFLGLFAMNLFTTLITNLTLQDPDTKMGFRLVSVLLNAIFISIYFRGQMKDISDKIAKDIKNIIEK